MAVYLPTAVLGEGSVLVTLGSAGEIMGFFYPRVNFARNVRECMPAIHAPAAEPPRFCWLFEPEWSRRQQYAEGAGIVLTELTSARLGVTVRITDLLVPGSAVLARRFAVENHRSQACPLTLMQYLRLALGDLEGRQSVRYLPDGQAVVQYCREVAFAVGGSRFDSLRCGRAAAEDGRSAKDDMLDGQLTGQAEDIGTVDFAVAWHLTIPAQGTETRTLLIAAGDSEKEARTRLHGARRSGFGSLYNQRKRRDAEVIAPLRRVSAPSQATDEVDRALLALLSLQDDETGAIIAAPEFDPDFEISGGYGFCWPRDAAYAALTLARLGHADRARRFFDWCRRVQRSDGLWDQRYWADGCVAPRWSTPDRFEQLDESASVLFALARHHARASDDEKQEMRSAYGDMVASAVRGLLDRIGPTGMHAPAADLWESFQGSFAYTNAAIHAALRDGAEMLAAGGQGALAQEARAAATRMKAETERALWTGSYMARGLRPDGSLDKGVDCSVLGVWEPFGMLSMADPRERDMLLSTVAALEEHLTPPEEGATGLFRYQFDTYIGGAIGCVNTLWLAKVLLLLGRGGEEQGAPDAGEHTARGRHYLDFCRAHLAGCGMVPELIGRTEARPYWAAPHAWSTALMLDCLLLLPYGEPQSPP
ncbi:MAG: glycoside hydrolase family 15 protein [Armatimonadota bacterium]